MLILSWYDHLLNGVVPCLFFYLVLFTFYLFNTYHHLPKDAFEFFFGFILSPFPHNEL